MSALSKYYDNEGVQEKADYRGANLVRVTPVRDDLIFENLEARLSQ